MMHVAYENGCGNDTEFFTMLQYFHDVGVVLFFGEKARETSTSSSSSSTSSSPLLAKTLSNMVVLHPQWLVDAFRQIVTADKSRIPHKLLPAYKKFEKKGLLDRELLDAVWKRSFDSEERDFLLDSMEKFDLLCAKRSPSSTTLAASVDGYFVPLRLRAKGSDLKPKHFLNKTSFFLDFYGFLPEGLFHRLLTRVIKWAQEKGDEEPKIGFHQGGSPSQFI